MRMRAWSRVSSASNVARGHGIGNEWRSMSSIASRSAAGARSITIASPRAGGDELEQRPEQRFDAVARQRRHRDRIAVEPEELARAHDLERALVLRQLVGLGQRDHDRRAALEQPRHEIELLLLG